MCGMIDTLIFGAVLFTSHVAAIFLGAWIYSAGRAARSPLPTFPKKPEPAPPEKKIPFVEVKP
jgi:hypothetical protein